MDVFSRDSLNLILINRYITIMNTIKEFTHPNLGVRMDVKNFTLSTLLLALGIGLTIYSFYFESAQDDSAAIMIGLGVGCIIAAIVCYVVAGKALYFLPTMAKVEFKSWHFDAEVLPILKNVITSGDFKNTPKLTPKEIGNVRMDILKASDNTFAAIQLYKYAELCYQPQTEVRVLNVGEVEALLENVKK